MQNANTLCAQLNWDATDDVKEVAKQMEKKRLLLRKKSYITIEDDNSFYSIKDSHIVGCLFDVINR